MTYSVLKMMADFNVRLANWSDEADRQALREIRRLVFIEEQNVPIELEWDDFDKTATHLLATDKVSGQPIGTARMVIDPSKISIGRMAVLANYRQQGIGSALLNTLVNLATEQGYDNIQLSAQTHATEFYHKLGFEQYGGEFLDAGIPHYAMRLRTG